jgi:hypothetical protein
MQVVIEQVVRCKRRRENRGASEQKKSEGDGGREARQTSTS